MRALQDKLRPLQTSMQNIINISYPESSPCLPLGYEPVLCQQKKSKRREDLSEGEKSAIYFHLAAAPTHFYIARR
jgi:hypothetical protein